MNQPHEHHKRIASVLVLTGVFGLALGLASWQENKQNSLDTAIFSADTLKSLENLNLVHGMQMQSLVGDEASPTISGLFQANVLAGERVDEDQRGLIISIENSDELMLFQPLMDLDDSELESIAENYMDEVPEIHVELDQDIELFGVVSFGRPVPRPEDETELASEILMEVPEVEESTLSPVHIAVIDSGVDTTHEVFEGTQFIDGWNAVDHNTNMSDEVGHGTHIASIITSNVPGAVIGPYKIVDENGGRLSNVLEGFDHAIEDNVDIINTSFGLLGPSLALETLINEANEEGILIVSAAGNRNTSSGFYPAAYEGTISVASVDSYGDKMPKSNWGYWIDVAALGSNLYAALPDNEYGYKSGTSQACAVVSAAAAQVMNQAGLQNRLSQDEVFVLLTEERDKVGPGNLEGVPIIE